MHSFTYFKSLTFVIPASVSPDPKVCVCTLVLPWTAAWAGPWWSALSVCSCRLSVSSSLSLWGPGDTDTRKHITHISTTRPALPMCGGVRRVQQAWMCVCVWGVCVRCVVRVRGTYSTEKKSPAHKIWMWRLSYMCISLSSVFVRQYKSGCGDIFFI